MEIQLLGPLTLVHGEVRQHVCSKRVRTVLALLALPPGTPLQFEQLMEELWGDRELENMRNALQANVLRARKILGTLTGRRGDEVVRTVSGGYVLDLDPQSVDANRFLSLAARGSARVQSEPEESVRLLEQALNEWRGPALFDIYEGPRIQLETAHLQEQRLCAREDLIAAKLSLGDARGVIPELLQLIAQHPGRERFSEQLMLALYRNGRQTEALDVFHRTRRWMVKELGLEPGRGLSRIYQSILTQDAALG
ncbi:MULTISPECIES: AfsR/SARP family transcriptional regulator [Streptomyces]|uniref:AfsR/SARP family transcriptional regulator n=1 Tax=Streptomyces lycii TaxID=2654337 RepID=A0ABQ7FDV5_9ACTN|nr:MULTISPECIES: AfsR/SARP family transcriptional regulator [Streptomyces]KAF4406772.1 AfsR/SARP family transcriptional regulator [Streptomyces lycii]PGH49847.1 SARP family transcriptional regulator [Streptomyces sp. Ru87]